VRIRTPHLRILATLALLLVAGCGPAVEPADLVLRNGRIVTVDESRPEAEALAVRGDTIVAVGSNSAIGRYVGPRTEVVDLAGRLAIPGFIEGHGHFLGLGNARMQLRLADAKSWDEIVRRVEEAAKRAPPGEWIRGRGWHQEKWDAAPSPAVEGFPTHAALSRVSPANPVYLTHASGHASFVNAKALELSGITRATRDPAGGEILRDAHGNATGLLRETASGLVKAPPLDDPELIRRQALAAADEVVSKGITTFEDAGTSFASLAVLKAMAERGELPLRLWMMVRDSVENLRAQLADFRTVGAADRRFTVRAIKLTIDGALGSRGAWLLEPYSDLPGSRGLNTAPLALANEIAGLAATHDYQFCVHAIGDRANREALDIFERVYGANPGRELRWRIEHAQHLHPDDIPRFGRLGVVAMMQGVHCTSDAPFVTARLGPERAEQGAYVWRRLIDSGAVVGNGTDAPVEDVDPIASFHASITRKLADGATFYPDQRMTRAEALKSYTWNNAWAAFEEDVKGSLAPGMLADIAVLSKDIMTIPEDEIPTARVAMTIVGGKVVYRAPIEAAGKGQDRP
jgi:predicted amidohydrolase YtcJ